jgi:lipoprotein signal peptidase
MRRIYQIVYTTALGGSIGCLLVKRIMTMLIQSTTQLAIFELDIVKNKGFFMGLWKESPMLIRIVMGAFFLLFCFMLYKTAKAYPKVSTIYILAPWMLLVGLTGNMTEMLLNCSVTDYIAIRQPWVETFFFNIEDCLIQAGAILFTYQSIFHNKTIEKIYKG